MTDFFQWQCSVDDSFKEFAACRGMDPEFFMPSVGKHGKEAKEVCKGRKATRTDPGTPPCPVRQQCLEYCLSLPGPVVGIWGGLTERERRLLNRTTPPVRTKFYHGTAHGYKIHMEMKTKPCDACRRAHTAANQAWRDKQRDSVSIPALRELLETVAEVHRDAPPRPAE